MEPLGFKMGDGKWGVKNDKGEIIPSVDKKLYKTGIVNFDILHVNDGQLKDYLIKLYPDIGCPDNFVDGVPVEDMIDEYKKILR